MIENNLLIKFLYGGSVVRWLWTELDVFEYAKYVQSGDLVELIEIHLCMDCIILVD